MYSFDHGELPNHFDAIVLLLHQSTNVKQGLLLCKNII